MVNHIVDNGWQANLKGFERDLVLRQAFVEVYKINNVERNPFALVSDSDVDGLHELGWHYKVIENFAKYEVGQMYNVSLKDFLDFPQPQCEFMIHSAKLKFEHKTKVVNQAQQEHEQQERENERRQQQLLRQSAQSKMSWEMPKM